MARKQPAKQTNKQTNKKNNKEHTKKTKQDKPNKVTKPNIPTIIGPTSKPTTKLTKLVASQTTN